MLALQSIGRATLLVFVLAFGACGGGSGGSNGGGDAGGPDVSDVPDARTPDAADAAGGPDATEEVEAGTRDASGVADAADATDAADDADVTDAAIGVDASDATDAAIGVDTSDATDAAIAMDARDATDAAGPVDARGVADAEASDTNGTGFDGAGPAVDAPKQLFVLAGRYGHAATNVGDVDGDGKLDLINAGTDAQVWLGRGDGTFSNDAVASSLGWSFSTPRYVGRFDRDDRADIATLEPLPNNGGMILRLASGQPDGTLRKPPVADVVSGTAQWFLVGQGEFTGDGFDDLLFVGGSVTGTSQSRPAYYVASTSGTIFSARSTPGTVRPTPQGVPTVYTTFAGGIGDVDGDGKLDFLLNTTSAWLGGQGQTQKDGYVIYGKGDGTFEERGPFEGGLLNPFTPGAYAPSRLVALDGDRFADGVEPAAAWDVPSSVRWNNAGTLPAAVSLPIQFLEAGDFNGDGAVDLWGSLPGVLGGGSYAALPGDGQRGFGAALASVSLSGVRKTIARDVDKDGTTDLVIVDATSTSIYLSTAKKPFAGPPDIPCCTGPTGF